MNDTHRCWNCIDPVFMTEVSTGLYRCPVCGDELDMDFLNESIEPFDGNSKPLADERGPYEWMYGNFGSGDPRDFQPDYELCTVEEVEVWKADVARAEAGETVIAHPAGHSVYDAQGKLTLHILAPKYGIGTYKARYSTSDAE